MVKEKQSSSAEPDGARLPPLPQPLWAPGSHPLKDKEGPGCVLPGAAATPPCGPSHSFPCQGAEAEGLRAGFCALRCSVHRVMCLCGCAPGPSWRHCFPPRGGEVPP